MTIREDRHGLAVQASRPYSSQSVAIGSASVLSAPLSISQDRPQRESEGGAQFLGQPNHTRHVRIVATAACWVAFGTAPIAVLRAANSMYLPAGLPEYFWVQAGEQIAVIQDAAAGFLYITELTN
jgi:hypothetical protein